MIVNPGEVKRELRKSKSEVSSNSQFSDPSIKSNEVPSSAIQFVIPVPKHYYYIEVLETTGTIPVIMCPGKRAPWQPANLAGFIYDCQLYRT